MSAVKDNQGDQPDCSPHDNWLKHILVVNVIYPSTLMCFHSHPMIYYSTFLIFLLISLTIWCLRSSNLLAQFYWFYI